MKTNYQDEFILENMMGPNPIRTIEELTLNLGLHEGMKVLDLGCGKGITSYFLAKEFGVQVYAVDLWIEAGENYRRFQKMGIKDEIVPIFADANKLPFAESFFDMIISVDAYCFFGYTPEFMDKHIAPFVKPGGKIALSFPGFVTDFKNEYPEELLLSWTAEDLKNLHSSKWWWELLKQSKKIELQSINEMECCEQCWKDWLACDNVYAIHDRKSMDAGAGKYMSIISVIAERKEEN